MGKETAASGGVGFGSAAAMISSYTKWHSIWWMLLHGVFSWGYVIYYAIKY
jgi:hypothetical protein